MCGYAMSRTRVAELVQYRRVTIEASHHARHLQERVEISKEMLASSKERLESSKERLESSWETWVTEWDCMLVRSKETWVKN